MRSNDGTALFSAMELHASYLTDTWGEAGDFSEVHDRLTRSWRDVLDRVLRNSDLWTQRSYVYVGERTYHMEQFEASRQLALSLSVRKMDFRIIFSGGMFDR